MTMTPMTVLVADASLVIRAEVRRGLADEGYRVTEAVDGLVALDQCRHEPPDVVLLDTELPGLDGYRVLAELKNDPNLKDIPVVFLANRCVTPDVVARLRAGAHDYLSKPVATAELLARVGSAVQVKKLQDELQRRNAELNRMRSTDALTGLFHRQHIEEELARRYSDARRHHDPLCILLLDLDDFRHINDTYGYPAGDVVLRKFAERLHTELRAGDVAGRWGGEEFLILLPRTDLKGAAEVAERIRYATAAEPVAADGHDIGVTISGGCVLGPGDSTGSLMELADRCMHQAKLAGRNQIATAELPRSI
jgi:diguanylate cyclase (GGDEF)-like protein